MSLRSSQTGAAGAGPLVLAVDLGTSGCKCALVSLDGAVAAWAFEPVPLHVDGVTAEQDPHDWWQAFMTTASTLCAATCNASRRPASRAT